MRHILRHTFLVIYKGYTIQSSNPIGNIDLIIS